MWARPAPELLMKRVIVWRTRARTFSRSHGSLAIRTTVSARSEVNSPTRRPVLIRARSTSRRSIRWAACAARISSAAEGSSRTLGRGCSWRGRSPSIVGTRTGGSGASRGSAQPYLKILDLAMSDLIYACYRRVLFDQERRQGPQRQFSFLDAAGSSRAAIGVLRDDDPRGVCASGTAGARGAGYGDYPAGVERGPARFGVTKVALTQCPQLSLNAVQSGMSRIGWVEYWTPAEYELCYLNFQEFVAETGSSRPGAHRTLSGRVGMISATGTSDSCFAVVRQVITFRYFGQEVVMLLEALRTERTHHRRPEVVDARSADDHRVEPSGHAHGLGFVGFGLRRVHSRGLRPARRHRRCPPGRRALLLAPSRRRPARAAVTS